MLTDEKRKKLLAGVLAVVMLTGVAGCGNDKDSEWKNDNSAQNNQDEKKDEDMICTPNTGHPVLGVF